MKIKEQESIVYKHYHKGMLEVGVIEDFLYETDNYFIPPKSKFVNLSDWAVKLHENADFITAESDGKIVGWTAFYFNEKPKYSYGTHLAVLENYSDERLIGAELIMLFVDYCEKNNSEGVQGEIRASNKPLFRFYKSLGFEIKKERFSEVENELKYDIQKTFTDNKHK